MARARKAPAKAAAGAKVVPLRPPAKCPICGKPAVREYYPFSSKRCADVDLHKWLSGSYAIAAVEAEPEGEPAEGDGDGSEES